MFFQGSGVYSELFSAHSSFVDAHANSEPSLSHLTSLPCQERLSVFKLSFWFYLESLYCYFILKISAIMLTSH